MYQIEGRELLYAWLAREHDPNRRQAMLDWLVSLARDPRAEAHRLPSVDAPVYLTFLPLDPVVVVEFLIAEEFQTVRLLNLGSLP